MITVRRAGDRGHADHGWLDTHHTFSFADYRDPAHMGFRTLRVLNEDRVQPGTGFGTHPHRDMEIVTWVLEGAVEHHDSMGNGSVIRAGEVQRMTAGTGVTHSEHNASRSDPLHLVQIWILPERGGLEPGYEQREVPRGELRGRLRRIAGRDGGDGAVHVHQDAEIWAAVLAAGESARHEVRAGRGIWVQVLRGRVEVAGETLEVGDGAAIEDVAEVALEGRADGSEVLLFDLA